jgi:mono/diheme cytochrome c family protein
MNPHTPLEHLDEHDVHDIHDALLREQPDPEDGFEPLPIWLGTGFVLLTMWGFWYFGHYDGHFSRDAFTLDPLPVAAGAQAAAPQRDVAALGAEIYGRCAACHQQGGEGVPGAFPPLAGSERVMGSPTALAHILLAGLQGEIEVKGTKYKGVMPAWADQLTDEEIAAVLTHVRSSFGNDAEPVPASLVTTTRAAVEARGPKPYSDAELDGIKE